MSGKSIVINVLSRCHTQLRLFRKPDLCKWFRPPQNLICILLLLLCSSWLKPDDSCSSSQEGLEKETNKKIVILLYIGGVVDLNYSAAMKCLTQAGRFYVTWQPCGRLDGRAVRLTRPAPNVVIFHRERNAQQKQQQQTWQMLIVICPGAYHYKAKEHKRKRKRML